MSQLALLLFGIIFILDNIIKLPPWIFIVLVLPYALWVLVSFSEYEYWVTFWLATGVLYFGIFLLCGFLSNKLNVEANFGFNFITDELKERNYNSEETEETQETEEAEEAEEAEEQSKNNKGNSKKE
jgi:predicted membrane protein